MKIKIVQLLTLVTLVVQILIPPKVDAQEINPDEAIRLMYLAVANLHNREAVPRVYRPVPSGFITGCGEIPGSNAVYCPADHSIYITIDMARLAYSFGDAALAYVIGHEYAHGMQTVYGFGAGQGAINELQADCLAGLYMAATPDIVFDEQDIWEVAALANNIGDYNYWSQQHHGTPEQRVEAVVHGLQSSDYSACF
jgi:uncharacterized protein